MRIEPVYLVAPKPKPPSIPTRRAFLLAGGTFFFGALVGGACGYAAGSAVGGSQNGIGVQGGGSAFPKPAELEPTGDANLDALRKLAVGPIADLVAKWQPFLSNLSTTYPQDAILWEGTNRLAQELLDNSAIPSRRLVAISICSIAKNKANGLATLLAPKLGQLQKLK